MKTETDAELSRLQATVYGRVQGVGFRYFTLSIANELGLFGWVRNMPDGSVQLVAEGPKEQLNKFVSRLRIGPHSGHVDDFRHSWQAYRAEFDRFEIRV